jgi:hypothetical protein
MFNKEDCMKLQGAIFISAGLFFLTCSKEQALSPVGGAPGSQELTKTQGASASDRYVDASASPGGDGLSWATAYDDLQEALGAAAALTGADPGAKVNIHIAKGTYFPSVSGDTSASFVLRNNVRLIGGYPNGGGARDASNATVLSGAKGCVHILQAVSVNCTAVMDGLTISGGGRCYGSYQHTSINGLGLMCVNASPMILNCRFVDNVRNDEIVSGTGSTSNEGGAVFDSLSSPVFENCAFVGNGTNRGSAIFNTHSSPTVVNCEFADNITTRNFQAKDWGGGGICNFSSSPRIAGCLFRNNFSVSGGAISNCSLSSPTISRCRFENNRADEFQGGAIANTKSNPDISNCFFSANRARGFGGGAIHNDSGSSPKIVNCAFYGNRMLDSWSSTGGGAIANANASSPLITNCTFDSNYAYLSGFGGRFHGGAIYDTNSSSVVTNCTFVRNVATYGGAYHGTSGIFTNCIFWRDSSYDDGRLLQEPSELSPGIPGVRNCVIFGGYTGGVSVITQDPNLGPLVDNGGAVPTCAIPPESPARNAGTATVPTGADISTDGRGMPRTDGQPDIGAYEVSSTRVLNR